jgi:hypothetical protein
VTGTDLVHDTPKGLLKALRALDAAEVLHATELVLPYDLSFVQYERLGFALGLFKRASSWWIGDWIIYGEKTYGEKYAQASEATRLTPETLRNYVWVCSKVAPSRRRTGIPFSVHAEVAPLTPREQRRWLAVAEHEGLTQRELRERIRAESDLLGERAPGATLPPVPGGRQADDQDGEATPRETGRGPSVVETTPSGLPVNYVVPGPICRRLVRDAIAGRDGYMRVPRDLIERLAVIVEA